MKISMVRAQSNLGQHWKPVQGISNSKFLILRIANMSYVLYN